MIKTRTFQRGRLSQQVVDELERLMAEEFPSPGDRWPREDDLAERFHVSRIVIREAIKVLEDRGVVEAQAGRGTFTRAPSLDRVKSSLLRLFNDQPAPNAEEMERILELREVLEETTAALAAVRANPDDLREMREALVDLAAEHDNIHQTAAADLRFHLAIAKAAHNRFFEMVLDPLAHAYLQQVALTDTFTVGIEQHRRIYEEISSRNPVGARQAVRRMMKVTRTDLHNALALLKANQNGGS